MKIKLLILVAPILMTFPSLCQIWDSLGTDLRGEAWHFKEYNGLLYVGIGDTTGGNDIYNIGTWDGVNWDTVGAGIDGRVFSSCLYHNKLFFGGYFDYVNGPWPGWPVPHVYNLTSWDGTQFFDLGYPSPFSSYPICLEEFQDELYIGFNMATINGITYYGIARYNDSTYNEVNGGVTGNPREVLAMTKFNNELVVAGFFLAAGSLPVNNIARWNGNQWLPMSDGLSYGVRALYADSINNVLYAGGSFSYSDTTFVNHIAKWNGISWQPVGNGLSDPVFSLNMYNGKLFAGTTSITGISSLWFWDGTQWNDVHPYPGGFIYNLKVYQNCMYVGGGYSSIGGVPWAGIAKYTDTTLIGLNEFEFQIQLFPNPTTTELKLKFEKPVSENCQVEISNMQGRVILANQIENGSIQMQIQLPQQISAGIYICKIFDKHYGVSKKFIVR